MTVAAVILSATAEGALAETQGQARVRRLADLAWSGGALPIVVALARSRRRRGREPRRQRGDPRPARAGRDRAGRPDGAGRGAGGRRGPRPDRGPALAGPHDLGRPRDRDLAHRGPRHRPRHDAAAGLARRTGLARRAPARPPRCPPGDAGGRDAARHRRAPGRRHPDAPGRGRRSGCHPRRRHADRGPARRTRGRPIRPPGTPTSGATTSSPRRASAETSSS